MILLPGQRDRSIDWGRDPAEVIIRKIRAADSAPGVLDRLYGKSYFLYGAHHSVLGSGKRISAEVGAGHGPGE